MQTTANLGLKKPDGTDVVNIQDFNDNADAIDLALAGKVDKVAGKQLSTEDYTTAEKSKLAGVATGANNYVHPSTHPPAIIAQDSSNRFVTDSEKSTWNGKAGTAVATTGANGLMSSADKSKLDGIAAGANAYVHPSGDGNQHVPATGTTHNGQVLKSGATAGSAAWGTLVKGDVGLGNVDNTADSAKNVASAAKLSTARTISLTGDVSGSASFDGSANASITATVADDSHNHIIANVDGLQSTLNAKADQSSFATHLAEDVHKLKLGVDAPNDDLNQCLTDGIYAFSQWALNSPEPSYGIVEVMVNYGTTYNGSSNWVFQRASLTNQLGNVYIRRKINADDWTPWNKVLTNQYRNSGGDGNCNDLTRPNMYYIEGHSGTNNAPNNLDGTMLVMSNDGPAWVTQLFMPWNGGIYIRQRLNGVWSSWSEVRTGSGFVTGTYTGNGNLSQDIIIGFTPSSVVVDSGESPSSYKGGLAILGTPLRTGITTAYEYNGTAYTCNDIIIEIIPNGFRVYYSNDDLASSQSQTNYQSIFTNKNGRVYNYKADR